MHVFVSLRALVSNCLSSTQSSRSNGSTQPFHLRALLNPVFLLFDSLSLLLPFPYLIKFCLGTVLVLFSVILLLITDSIRLQSTRASDFATKITYYNFQKDPYFKL